MCLLKSQNPPYINIKTNNFVKNIITFKVKNKMHIEISEHNAIYKRFDELRTNEGYTTFKAGVIAAMKLFILENTKHENTKTYHSVTGCVVEIENKDTNAKDMI